VRQKFDFSEKTGNISTMRWTKDDGSLRREAFIGKGAPLGPRASSPPFAAGSRGPEVAASWLG